MGEAQIETKVKVDVVKPEEIPHILEPGEIGAVLELVVSARDGQVTEKRVMKSKSFVRRFLEILWAQFLWPAGKGYLSSRDYAGGYASVGGQHENFYAGGGAGVTNHGVLVGTGTTPPTVDDYVMENQIAHGVGAGQLQYGATTFGAPASDATTAQFTVTRNFANGSGAAVTVNEIGLAVQSYQTSSVSMRHLIIRDVIAGGISVPNGQTLTVNYRIQVVA